MSWDYRIIRTHEGGEAVFAIHEVYYSDRGPPMWSENAAYVVGASVEELKGQLEKMTQAFDRPIFEVVGDALVEWKPK